MLIHIFDELPQPQRIVGYLSLVYKRDHEMLYRLSEINVLATEKILYGHIWEKNREE